MKLCIPLLRIGVLIVSASCAASFSLNGCAGKQAALANGKPGASKLVPANASSRAEFELIQIVRDEYLAKAGPSLDIRKLQADPRIAAIPFYGMPEYIHRFREVLDMDLNAFLPAQDLSEYRPIDVSDKEDPALSYSFLDMRGFLKDQKTAYVTLIDLAKKFKLEVVEQKYKSDWLKTEQGRKMAAWKDYVSYEVICTPSLFMPTNPNTVWEDLRRFSIQFFTDRKGGVVAVIEDGFNAPHRLQGGRTLAYYKQSPAEMEKFAREWNPANRNTVVTPQKVEMVFAVERK